MKKFLIILGGIIYLWCYFFINDYVCFRRDRLPIFSLELFPNSEAKVFYGVGYKIVYYNIPNGYNGIHLGTWFMKVDSTQYLSYEQFVIVDNTESCQGEKELFYQNDYYEYYFDCEKSNNVIIKYETTEENIKDALNYSHITIEQLKDKIDFTSIPKYQLNLQTNENQLQKIGNQNDKDIYTNNCDITVNYNDQEYSIEEFLNQINIFDLMNTMLMENQDNINVYTSDSSNYQILEYSDQIIIQR